MGTNSRTKNTYLNISFLLMMQVVVAIVGLVLPRYFIEYYGSETNGLIQSITQFLSYITLLEGGAGGVISVALYKPLAENDDKKVTGIIKASSRFYRKIAIIFLFYVVGLCFIYPLISNTSFDFWYITALILILSVGTIIEYLVGLTYKSLIIADQKSRIMHLTDTIALVVNLLVSYLLIKWGFSIFTVKIANCIIFAFKPFISFIYVKKHYKLDKDTPPDNYAISQRKNGLVHQIAFFIHSNTDVFLITIFINNVYVSIYTVYSAVVYGIERIATCFTNGSSSSIGNLISKESKEHLRNFFDKFEFIQMAIITILFTITAIMIVPFVMLYSNTFTDANYIYPLFAYFLILAEATYCVRCIYNTVSTCANKFKETQLGAILEAIVNIVLSIILIQYLDILGVAIGTFVAMFTRLVFELYYMSKNVVGRSILKGVKCIAVNIIVCGISVMALKFINFIQVNSWLTWIVDGVYVSAVVCVISIIVYIIFYRNILFNIIKSIFKRKVKSNNV